MKRLLLPLIFPICLSAQYQNYNGGRSSALAHSSVALIDLWSASNNQAGLAFLEHQQIGAFYQNRYFLKELMIGNVVLALPLSKGTLGAQLQYSGFSLFNRTKLGFSYAHKLSSYMSAGIAINYEYFYIDQGSNNKAVPTFEIGLLYKPLKSVNVGLHFYNPTNQSLNDEVGDNLPVIVRFGTQKAFGNKSLLSLEVIKQQGSLERYSLGVEYNLIDLLALRTGASIQPLSAAWGVGFHFPKVNIDLSYEYMPILGSSGTLTLNYSL